MKSRSKMKTWIVVCGDTVAVRDANSLEEAKTRAEDLDTSQGMYIAEIVASCIPKPKWVAGDI